MAFGRRVWFVLVSTLLAHGILVREDDKSHYHGVARHSTEARIRLSGNINCTCTLEINHYKFKSKEEFEESILAYNSSAGYMQNKNQRVQKNDDWEEISNRHPEWKIKKYIPGTRKLMRKKLMSKEKDQDIAETTVGERLVFCANSFVGSGVANYSKPRQFLSSVSIFRGENAYLREWLSYHTLLGVDHFFMYCNEQNITETFMILSPYIKAGVVTLIEFPDGINPSSPDDVANPLPNYSYTAANLNIQNFAYHHWKRYFGNFTEWILRTDIDEFLVPVARKGHDDECYSITDVLTNNPEEIGEYSIPLYSFGHNNLTKTPKGLVIENYNYSSRPVRRTISKQLIQARWIDLYDTKASAHGARTIAEKDDYSMCNYFPERQEEEEEIERSWNETNKTDSEIQKSFKKVEEDEEAEENEPRRLEADESETRRNGSFTVRIPYGFRGSIPPPPAASGTRRPVPDEDGFCDQLAAKASCTVCAQYKDGRSDDDIGANHTDVGARLCQYVPDEEKCFALFWVEEKNLVVDTSCDGDSLISASPTLDGK